MWKELAFLGVIKKVLVFGPGSSMGCNTTFPGLRSEVSFYLEFLTRYKPKNSSFFKKVAYALNPSPSPILLDLFWMELIASYRLATTKKYIIIVVAYRSYLRS